MRRKFLVLVLQFAVPVALFALLRSQWRGLNLSFAQLLVFPLVVLFFLRLRVAGLRIPRAMLLLAAAGALAAFSVPYLYPAQRRIALVSTLASDDFESESRVFWQELEQWLRRRGGAHARAWRFYGTLSNQRGAAAVLKTYPGAMALVWGDTKWVNISLPGSPLPGRRDPDLRRETEALLGVEVVSSIPVIGMSYQPRGDTARFVAALISGIGAAEGSAAGRAESELRYAGERAAFWLSNAHRGLAWFLLGNLQLHEALADGRYQPALFECAENAYTAAAGNLMPWDNPELYAAIHNNLGALYYLQSRFGSRSELLKRARRKWVYAVRTRKLKNPFDMRYRAAKVAKRNIKLIFGRRQPRGGRHVRKPR